ncbi:MAG TPA: hypothetical protein VMA35_14365, partial [Candidatus Sulfopaludibacter sp.]|nr:hypothetical protein [Candidatus Sulfopaludibacter sp.]
MKIKGILQKLLFVSLIISVISAIGEPASKIELPGLRPDGSALLPNQWSLRPAGRQVELGDFPV